MAAAPAGRARGAASGARPRVALTHDWLNSFGGAERVLAELQHVFPGAPIHTSVYEPSGLPPELRDWDVRPSFLNRVPFARRHHRPFLPLMPLAFESFDLRGYDVVLTTATACAKGVIVPPGVPNVCYCYTPPRYLWDQFHEQTSDVRGRLLVSAVAAWLRVWDRLAADRVDQFIAISETVAQRIRSYYRREPIVIYPPVDVERVQPNGRLPEDFYLIVSRLVPYKRVDLAVEAAQRGGFRLVVVGDGPELGRLRARAGASVTFLGRRPDAEVADLYARCRAFLFPGLEDFGIAPVEAQAAGRPVVAFGAGGATETIVDGETGVLIESQSVEAVVDGVERLESLRIDPAACRDNALRFTAERFRRQIAAVVADAVAGRRLSPPRTHASPTDVGTLSPR
jgi:glycosyltransferase involved in cell wall biosynthesis